MGKNLKHDAGEAETLPMAITCTQHYNGTGLFPEQGSSASGRADLQGQTAESQ